MTCQIATKVKFLQRLLGELLSEDVITTYSALDNHSTRIAKRKKLPRWSRMSSIQQEELLSCIKKEAIRCTESAKHHSKKWHLDDLVYNTRELYRVANEWLEQEGLNTEWRLPTEQNFGSKIQQFQAVGADFISAEGEILDLSELVLGLCQFAKKMPCTVYNVCFKEGPFKEYRYVGVAQITLYEKEKMASDKCY